MAALLTSSAKLNGFPNVYAFYTFITLALKFEMSQKSCSYLKSSRESEGDLVLFVIGICMIKDTVNVMLP